MSKVIKIDKILNKKHIFCRNFGLSDFLFVDFFFEDENFVAYTEGDRAYIKFVMIPQRQLIVALKRRKWWWNSSKQAWSTYLNRLDREWISNISKQYEKYI